ncbi:hypothetical protein [Zhihengliuella flava]|uniref:Uncharacterized protein n=1 Tax=Zhihengliuella flava TaxID=1285193 RepID=A0A931D5Q8_9MICC|nr:hypothetical protein [Zhihengliuella flava]MBG6084914.1 hypothetical protein [Zhihengliuella flava]
MKKRQRVIAAVAAAALAAGIVVPWAAFTGSLSSAPPDVQEPEAPAGEVLTAEDAPHLSAEEIALFNSGDFTSATVDAETGELLSVQK